MLLLAVRLPEGRGGGPRKCITAGENRGNPSEGGPDFSHVDRGLRMRCVLSLTGLRYALRVRRCAPKAESGA